MSELTPELRQQVESLVEELVTVRLGRAARARQPDFLTAAEFAQRLAMDVQFVRKLIRRGEITCLDINKLNGGPRMLRIPIEEYRRFVADRTEEAWS